MSRRNRRAAYRATQTRRCLRCPSLIHDADALFCPRCQRAEEAGSELKQGTETGPKPNSGNLNNVSPQETSAR